MAPSAGSNIDMGADDLSPRRNVAFAVNYEVSMVDQFLASERKRRSSTVVNVESVLGSTSDTNPTKSTSGILEHHVSQHQKIRSPSATQGESSKELTEQRQPHQDGRSAPPQVTFQSPLHCSNEDKTRRSLREKQKREVSLARARVRYDMQLVPTIHRSKKFLQTYDDSWPLDKTTNTLRIDRLEPQTKPNAADENYPPCDLCGGPRLAPFEGDTSVLWIPSKRSEWEDTVSEMTAVCTSAALRRHISVSGHSTAKPFHAPLSKEYIRDRVDIDEPLNGYQIRHRTGGWLQGFVLWTNFTTWTHFFKWDSRHPISGIPRADSTNFRVDVGGSLSSELEAQPRSGDPLEGGVVFPSIAEIGLLGGLGCGAYLLRMALEDIVSKKQYRFVVLQATDSSKTFYEKFGFTRVGAISRYGSGHNGQYETPIMGYRHWTYANESERSLQMHGGPSYMMCLKLPFTVGEACASCGRPPGLSRPPFMDAMLALAVEEKPIVEQLGVASTPGPKPKRTTSIVCNDGNPEGTPVKRRPGRPKGSTKRKNLLDSSPALGVTTPNVSPNVGRRKTGKLPLLNCGNVEGDSLLTRKSVISQNDQSVDKNNVEASSKKRKSEAVADNVEVSSKKRKTEVVPNNVEAGSKKRKSDVVGSTSTKVEDAAPSKRIVEIVAELTPDTDAKPGEEPLKLRKSESISVDEKGSTVKEPQGPDALSSVCGMHPKADDVSSEQRKPDNSAIISPNGRTSLTPLPNGHSLSYVQKQYQSIWLAVPPKLEESATGRPPPKDRSKTEPPASTTAVSSGKKVARKAKAKTATPGKEKEKRTYHCIRGPDGRFIRVNGSPTNAAAPQAVAVVKKAPTPKKRKPVAVDKSSLRKQKVKSYPRSRMHYYNRVVKPTTGASQYFFVLNYDELKGTIRVIPMVARGCLTGKREGRPRYQALVGDTDYNFQTFNASDYKVVTAVMVMKTPLVASEAWDIEDD